MVESQSSSLTSLYAAAAVYEAPVRVSFAMPYRCEFGQNLCLIGSTLDLGGWDTQRCVNMQWTAGDVWKVELEIRAR